MHLSGVFPARVTPFHSDGTLHVETFELLIGRLYEGGADGLCVCGQTGEGMQRPMAQRKLVAEHSVRVSPVGKPVIVHVGANSTREACAACGTLKSEQSPWVAPFPKEHLTVSNGHQIPLFAWRSEHLVNHNPDRLGDWVYTHAEPGDPKSDSGCKGIEMRGFILAVLFLALCPFLLAQQTQQNLNTDTLVKLQNAGVSDDVIIALINTSPCSFDTSPDGFIALKNAGVHSDVVIAIINHANSMGTSPRPRAAYIAPPVPAPDDADDPLFPHEAGVYLFADSPDGKAKMTFIDRVGESAMKVSNLMGAAFSFGTAKMKLRAQIPGPHANVRTTEKRPQFYMYFPDTSSFAAFGAFPMVSSPSQFSLLALDAQKDNRETVIASMGMTGGSIGADQKKTVAFTTDRLRAGVYKITPSADLKPGEYAFVAVLPGGTSETPPTMVVYAFGVDTGNEDLQASH